MNPPTKNDSGGPRKGPETADKGDYSTANTPSALHRSPSLAIVGGGIAGLAAAVAAVQRGWHVELFEQGNNLGGRAGSFLDSETGDRIDYCQHVAMGCCTSFLDFCRRTGIDDCFERSKTLHFIGPDATRHDFTAYRWLPRPLHMLPGLLGLKYLSIAERWGVIRALAKLTRQRTNLQTLSPLPLGEGPGVRAEGHDACPSRFPEENETIAAWLRRHGQSERAIKRFWSVVLTSALAETVDHASLTAAGKVFCEGFLASRGASDLVLPRRPLGEIFHDRVGSWLMDQGVAIHLGTPVRQIEGDAQGARAVVLADGSRRAFDFTIVAVPWRTVRSLFSEKLLAAVPALASVERIESAAITAVHIWYDRPIMPLPHAVLVDRLSQWLFADARSGPAAYHYQVVISASHRLPERTHDELLTEVCGELESFYCANVGATVELPSPRLIHSRIVTQPVFSPSPGADRFRPLQQTPVANLVLAGDWTATGWPATMEGAVRSGYRAVECIAASIDAVGVAVEQGLHPTLS